MHLFSIVSQEEEDNVSNQVLHANKDADKITQQCNKVICLSGYNEKSRYFFIEQEIKDLLKYNLQQRRNHKSFVTTSIYSKTDATTEFEEESSMLLNMETSCICRNEYAFTIILISLIILFDLLLFTTSCYHIWLYTRYSVNL
jgi:hypothetical protein